MNTHALVGFNKNNTIQKTQNYSLTETFKQNLPRLVGGTKFIADAMPDFGSSPIMIGVSALYLTSRIVLMAYGKEKSENENDKTTNSLKNKIDAFVPDILQEKPIEAASAMGGLACVGLLAQGLITH